MRAELKSLANIIRQMRNRKKPAEMIAAAEHLRDNLINRLAAAAQSTLGRYTRRGQQISDAAVSCAASTEVKEPCAQPMKRPRQMDPSSGDVHPVAESVPQPGQTDSCDSGHLAGAHTTCVTQAAVSDCLVVVRVVKTPWCDDMAAGLKFFECVGNHRTRLVNPFNSLKAGDLCVVVQSKNNKKVTAVAEVQGPQRLEQTDCSLLLQHLQPGRHDELQNFLGDAPSFNVVFFSKVYDCSHLNLTLPLLVRKYRAYRSLVSSLALQL